MSNNSNSSNTNGDGLKDIINSPSEPQQNADSPVLGIQAPKTLSEEEFSKENFKESIVSVLKYFEFINLEVDHIEEDDLHWLLFSKIDTTIGTLRLAISLQPYQVIAYAFHPLIVIEPIRTVAMEFVTRANFGLPYGKFELDLDRGDLRFATGAQQSIFRKTEFVHGFSIQQIGELLDNSIGTLSYYHSALIETLYNNVPPNESIRQLENPDENS